MRSVSTSCVIRWLVRLAVVALFAGLGLTFRYTLNMKIAPPAEKPARARLADEEICAGVILSQFGGGGHDLVSAEIVRTKRMRRGPFLLPARELVVEGLNLTLPESYFRPPETNQTAAAAAPAVQTGDLSTLMSGGERERGLMPSVKGLRVRGLRISRLEGGTNVVPWLVAHGGRIDPVSRGLKLDGAIVIENGRTNNCTGAVLAVEPYLRLR